MKDIGHYADFVTYLWKNKDKFTYIDIGRQLNPALNYQEDHCKIIRNNETNTHYLMIPGSGSLYYELTDEEAKKYLSE